MLFPSRYVIHVNHTWGYPIEEMWSCDQISDYSHMLPINCFRTSLMEPVATESQGQCSLTSAILRICHILPMVNTIYTVSSNTSTEWNVPMTSEAVLARVRESTLPPMGRTTSFPAVVTYFCRPSQGSSKSSSKSCRTRRGCQMRAGNEC